MLSLKNARSERMFVVVVHKMYGTAGDFHSVGECLLLSFESREGRQQGRVDVKDLARKLLDKPRREQAHISRKADEIDFVLLEGGNDFAVVLFACLAFGRDH